MPRGGHNKKQNALQVLEGRDRSDRMTNPPKVVSAFPVDAPEWLPEYAKLFWNRYAPLLNDAGIVTALDEAAFQVMALTYNSLMEAEKILDEEGLMVNGARGGSVKNPASSIVNATRQQFRLQCQQFGLDPAARDRLNCGSDDDTDEMEKLLNVKR